MGPEQEEVQFPVHPWRIQIGAHKGCHHRGLLGPSERSAQVIRDLRDSGCLILLESSLQVFAGIKRF